MDDTAYVALAKAQMPGLYRIAYSILRSRPDAEDAVQQALLSAWKHRDRARPGAERAWLARIVVNASRDVIRRRREVPVDSFPDLAAPSDAPDTGLYEAIDSLPELLRTPFLLKYMEGMTEKEVSLALRIPVSSVKGRLFRARKALKIALGEEDAP